MSSQNPVGNSQTVSTSTSSAKSNAISQQSDSVRIYAESVGVLHGVGAPLSFNPPRRSRRGRRADNAHVAPMAWTGAASVWALPVLDRRGDDARHGELVGGEKLDIFSRVRLRLCRGAEATV